MILCHSLSSRESLILSTTHKWSASCLLASVLLILSTGCWSSPNTEGTWSGTVSRRTLYVDGKECQAVLFKSAEGSEISPQLGSGYLVDKNNHLVDASSFKDNATVRVSGIAGAMLVTDTSGEFAEPRNCASGTEIGAIQVRSISLSSGETVKLRLAVATPTTQGTDSGKSRTP